jgi:hypothetical protein
MKGKRGAPLGNHNAYKHGFYSAGFKAAEKRLLSEVPTADLSAEIQLIRVTSLRFLQAMNAASQPLDFATQLSAPRALNLSAHSITSLLRVQVLNAAARDFAAGLDGLAPLSDSDDPVVDSGS